MWKTELGNAYREWLEGIYQKLLVKMKAECGRVGTKIPYSPKDGRYSDMAEAFPGGIGFWTNGFWPGMLWQMYSATEDEIYKETAEGVEERLAGLLDTFESLDHDIGFLFLPSAVANYRKTGNKDARRSGLHAANILAGRFNPVGKFIRAWNGSVGPVLGEKESSEIGRASCRERVSRSV